MKSKVFSTSALLFGMLLLPILACSQEEVASLPNEPFNSSLYSLDPQDLTIEEGSINDFNSFKKQKPTPPWFVKRFKVTAGIFFPINNTKVEVGNQNHTFGTTIDFEDDLGFRESTTTFLANLQWRISRRSRLDLSYFNLNRDSHHTLQKDIEFKDHTYTVNSDITAFFDTNIYMISYGYAFLTSPKYELGLMLGVHVLKSDVGINFEGNTASIGYEDSFGFTAPLPDIGIWGGYAFTDRLALNGNVSYLSVKIDNIDGKIISYNFSLMYEVVKNLDLALGYTGLNFTVDAEKNRAQGYLKWGYNGPSLTVSYSFGKKKF
jgi:hypothetical protein